ncbi:MAG: SUMF1/EgtB/PvdO family nonheme iron enzyme [Chloroflexota bacterium]
MLRPPTTHSIPGTPARRRLTIALPITVALVVSACATSAGPTPDRETLVPGSQEVSSSPPMTEAPSPTPLPGQIRVDPHGIEQLWVPAGEFQMGTDAATIAAIRASNPPSWVARELPSEQPAHHVRLTAGFWIDRHEVTHQAFQAFVDAGGYENRAFWSDAGWAWLSSRDVAALPEPCAGDAPDVPQRCITWYEAEAYAAWRGGALPSEAQWEYAARGPDSHVYPWGDEWDPARTNVVDSSAAVPVGSYPSGASWVSALDMAGNAMEWVADWLSVDYYASSPVDDPRGPDAGQRKVEKGGWWGSNEFVARSAYRHYEDPPTYGDEHIGFRIVSK